MDLQAWADSKGYRIASGPVSIIERIRDDIRGRHETGELSPKVYGYMEGMRYLDGLGFVPRSVLIVALPRVAHTINFSLPSGPREITIPPTYLGYARVRRQLQEELRSAGDFANLELLQAPLKSIATRLGLAMYGRNNIAYVPGFGSYHQLVGFVTDSDHGPSAREPGEPQIMPSCRDCNACMDACPAGAIGDDRFLLHGDRCLTMFNEEADPWPDWLPAKVHHALVGCMMCQEACPQNAALLRYERCVGVFDEAETAEILSGEGVLEGPLVAKLEGLGLDGYEPVIRRNLKAVLAG